MQFSSAEKKDFARKVYEYKLKVEEYIVPNLQYSPQVTIGEVGFGIRISGDYFYFDYPFGPGIEKINADLADDASPIGGIDAELFDAFYLLQERNHNIPSGYIYYEYELQDHQILANAQNNLPPISRDLILAFLPVIHASCYPGANHLITTLHTERSELEGKRCRRLLYLTKRLHDIINSRATTKPNVITAAFLCTTELQNPEATAKELYEKVFPFLEAYYESPLIVKLMEEKRKSHVMAFQHSYGNLAPVVVHLLNELQKEIKGNNALTGKIDHKLDRLHAALDAEYLTLTSMFQTEASFQSSEYHGSHPFSGKSLRAILTHYYTIANYLDAKAEIIIRDDDYDIRHYSPKDQDLPDIHLLLWNLWENACRESMRSSDKVIVCLDRNQATNSISVSFQNKGVLRAEYVAYINGENSYPTSIGPKQTYKGLEIVGDKLKERGWTWSLNSENGSTTITVNLVLS